MDKRILKRLRKLLDDAIDRGTPEALSSLAAGLEAAIRKRGGREPSDSHTGDELAAEIAERRRAEEDLRAAETKYRIVADNTYDWEFWTSPEGRFIYSSPSCERISGHAANEFEADPDLMMRIIHPDDQPRYAEHVNHAVAKKMPGQITFRIVQPNGSAIWIEHFCQPVFDPPGIFMGIRGSNRDITRRRLVEDELRQYRDRLEELVYERTAELEKTKRRIELILLAAGEGIFEIDVDGRVTFVNQAALRMCGWEEAEMLGKMHHALSHHTRSDGSAYPVEECPIHATIHDGASRRSSSDLFWRKDGTSFPVEYIATPIIAKGTSIGAVVVFNDITERMQAERRQRKGAELTRFLLDLYALAPQLTDEKLFDFFLERAVRITESVIGFFHQVSDDQNTIILTTWNRQALTTCTAVYDSHYAIGKAGNWADCVHLKRPVVYNDFPNSPNQKGLPPGHVQLQRFLSVPLIEGDRVRFIFGVGNKTVNYEEDDVSQLQLVAIDLHKILMRRRAEEALRENEEQLRQRNEIFVRDMEVAKRINRELLPDQPPDSGLFKIDFRYLPLDAIGGDFFSFTQLENNDIAVFIGDVAGHGVAAALFLALLKSTTERMYRKYGTRPKEYMTKLNRNLIGAMPSYFLTAIYGILSAGDDSAPAYFTFAKGAHPLPIIYRTATGTFEMLESGGTILGMIDDVEYEERTLPLSKGDRLFLYTDGIPEIKNEAGEILGFDELPALLEKANRTDFGDMLDAIIAEVDRFRGGAPINDDIILIGCEVI